MIIDLNPPRGVSDIELGMSVETAERALYELPGFVSPKVGEVRNRGFAHYDSGLSISLDFDRGGMVRAIEVFRPESEVRVLFRGMSVFEEPAEILIQRLANDVRIEIEDGGLNVIAPDVFIGFWRSVLPQELDDVSGRFFESALVAAPGYGF